MLEHYGVRREPKQLPPVDVEAEPPNAGEGESRKFHEGVI